MNKRLTDKELMKFSKILGAKEIIALYIGDKIVLTAKQLDRMIALKSEETLKAEGMTRNRKEKESEN